MQCRKFRKGKKTAKKMRRRKLQKKCNSENATLEVAVFFAFSVAFVLVPLHFLHVFRYFFR